MSLPSPLVRLCRVWVDLDGSVTISDGCIWFLQLDVDAADRERCPGYHFVGGGGGLSWEMSQHVKKGWTLTLLSWRKEQLGRGST